ncbi:hypothetical protein AMS68_005992 [Peltaster fructicola]|uniref:1-phosphatidylinositol 4-kinase n=1 Tax=Peltaster fructicola TaxID=286661 RepID=A0A6H0Y0P0_9PEZI|nr:hypothetical protein AMS68_005992 [Peltaster fructicola]
MSWDLLSRFIESEHFSKDASFTVAYLARYADHAGIHYVLCGKLRQFSYEEIEFFLPQLCHLAISLDNDAMVLEEFILDLAEDNTVGSAPERRRPKTTQTDVKRGPHKADGVEGGVSEGEQRPSRRRVKPGAHRQLLAATDDGFKSTSSLPDGPRLNGFASLELQRRPGEPPRRHSHAPRTLHPSMMSQDQKVRTLRQHYFRSEMQFLTALEGISSRLVSVPKPARLSALRAELALIAQDLPAEVDIPLICPPTLVDGIASKSKHHRIVRLNPNEATSLNSAEKVPYLMMLEVLKDDLDFDPESEHNQQLLNKLTSETGKQRRRLFDTADTSRGTSIDTDLGLTVPDSVFEPTQGDLSSPALLMDTEDNPYERSPRPRSLKDPPRLSSGVSTLSSTMTLPTIGDSEVVGRTSDSPGQRYSPYLKAQNPDQAEISALAVHMRTAAQMLAQLEINSQKRPRVEVAAIKAKIIASMQSFEEQSFLADQGLSAPTFESIMAKAGAVTSQAESNELDGDELNSEDPVVVSGRGAARMENDMKTGGVLRRGDRDDPSAAMFGEAWEQKKERIRKTSPYGWARNWDLISVILKTGDDLRQEAFACQLINICSKIWAEHDVDVWVKQMRILVTGESSGLIETITNAVSLHSLKRSLTLASTATGDNPKKRFATLQDHYTKTFGAIDTPTCAKAIDNFTKSLAAYSIISYILQLKDRHNGNILIDSEGHVVHIDFGFMLSNSPGNMGFEAAPFKLTMEYVELLGGVEGAAFIKFKDLLKDAFQALRREAERIVTLVELMGKESRMPAYGLGLTSVVAALRARFVLEKSKEEARDVVDDLVVKSVGSYYTRLYDAYQYRTQGIY